MTFSIVLVAIGGALGGIFRYAIANKFDETIYPFGTFIVNVVGSLILGIVLFSSASDQIVFLIGVGFCGAFTTFSSFSYQTLELWEAGRDGAVFVHAIGTIVMAFAGFSLAWLLVA